MPDNDSQHTLVRSYGLVFKIERKLFKIDRWRLPLPGDWNSGRSSMARRSCSAR